MTEVTDVDCSSVVQAQHGHELYVPGEGGAIIAYKHDCFIFINISDLACCIDRAK